MGMIETSAGQCRALKQRLLAAHGPLDDETLADTLEGATSFSDLIAEALRSALVDEAMVTALRGRIDALRERAERLKTRATAKREACARAMEACEIRKIAVEDMTVSLKTRWQQVLVEDLETIPAEFWRPAEPVLDRSRLADALRKGEAVTGARLVLSAPPP